MSRIQELANQSELDSILLLQNSRIGVASRPSIMKLATPLKQVDEELIREYNQQFQKGIEIQNPDGSVSFRKYVPVPPPELEELEEFQNIKKMSDKTRQEIASAISDINKAIERGNEKKNSYTKRINEGKITQEAGKVFIDNEDKTIKKYIERRKKLSDELLRDSLAMKQNKDDILEYQK